MENLKPETWTAEQCAIVSTVILLQWKFYHIDFENTPHVLFTFWICSLFIFLTAIQHYCQQLPDPENGKVRGSSLTFNSSVHINCNEGYNLVGSRLRRCNEKGQWSGNTSCLSEIVRANDKSFLLFILSHYFTITNKNSKRAKLRKNYTSWKLKDL